MDSSPLLKHFDHWSTSIIFYPFWLLWLTPHTKKKNLLDDFLVPSWTSWTSPAAGFARFASFASFARPPDAGGRSGEDLPRLPLHLELWRALLSPGVWKPSENLSLPKRSKIRTKRSKFQKKNVQYVIQRLKPWVGLSISPRGGFSWVWIYVQDWLMVFGIAAIESWTSMERKRAMPQ